MQIIACDFIYDKFFGENGLISKPIFNSSKKKDSKWNAWWNGFSIAIDFTEITNEFYILQIE